MEQNNIDFTAAKIAFEIAERINDKSKMETLINKSLGVLSANGIYALWLFLESENESKHINIIEIMKEFNIKLDGTNNEKMIINLSNDLQKLIYSKELLEKTFIYARYRAKAITKKGG